MYSETLEIAGYGVLTTHARDAAVVAAHREPDVVVVDPANADTGWQVCVELQGTCPHIPIVILTAARIPQRREGRRSQALANCVAILTQPCDGATLGSILERVCRS